MKIKSALILLSAFCCFSFVGTGPRSTFMAKSSVVSFLSKAKLEKITAASTDLKGGVDISKRTFNFAIPICSFQGFLNSKQKRHYCEKYVEGEKYPTAAFKGKIIEDVDLSVPGTYSVRAKGMFLLHGIEKESIITATIISKEGEIDISSKFTITLADFDMKLSKGSSLVIARVVEVQLQAVMVPE